MGTDGRGAKGFAALKPASTWGTAVQCGANDGLYLLADTGEGGPEIVPNRAATGKVFGNKSNRGQEMHRRVLRGDFLYGANCDRLIAGAMGTAANPTEVEASYEYTHALSFADRLTEFFSYALMKGDVACWEYPGAWINRLTIEITGRGPATIEAEVLCDSCVQDGSGTNTASTMASVTFPGSLTPVYLGDCRFRLNTQSGGALGAGNVVSTVDRIRITIDRKARERFLANQTLGRKMSQPTEDEDPEVTLEIGIDEYVAATWRDYADDATELKADLLIQGPDLPSAASSEEYEYSFDFPKLVAVERNDNAMDGPGRISDGIVFRCLEPSSAPTGMTTTDPFSCTVRNQRSANLLV